jgi:hypothetical protein
VQQYVIEGQRADDEGVVREHHEADAVVAAAPDEGLDRVLTASIRVRPPATVVVLSDWPEPISSCMLDDRSSSSKMSSPFDCSSACDMG